MLTSAWARLPVLGDYGTRDRIASLVARPLRYRSVADSRKANDIVTRETKSKNTNNNFNRRVLASSPP